MCLWEAGSVEINADDENVAADDESDASDDEEAMEVDGNASTDVTMEMEEAPATKVKAQAAPKLSTAVSGLPQSAEELESLIGLIHQTVNESVLPRLHKCLNAKVRVDVLVVFLKTFRSRVLVIMCGFPPGEA